MYRTKHRNGICRITLFSNVSDWVPWPVCNHYARLLTDSPHLSITITRGCWLTPLTCLLSIDKATVRLLAPFYNHYTGAPSTGTPPLACPPSACKKHLRAQKIYMLTGHIMLSCYACKCRPIQLHRPAHQAHQKSTWACIRMCKSRQLRDGCQRWVQKNGSPPWGSKSGTCRKHLGMRKIV